MKKLHVFVAVFILSGIAVLKMASAGSQYNWGSSSGANWVTPDDTKIQIGQALVVTSSVPYPTVGTSSTTAMGIASFTLAQLNAATPPFVGEIAYCSNCTNTQLVVSSGTAQGAWQGVFLSTGGGTTGKTQAL